MGVDAVVPQLVAAPRLQSLALLLPASMPYAAGPRHDLQLAIPPTPLLQSMLQTASTCKSSAGCDAPASLCWAHP